MKVGPSDTEFAATKIKYGARKRHRNRELAEDATPEPGVDNFEIVDVKVCLLLLLLLFILYARFVYLLC